MKEGRRRDMPSTWLRKLRRLIRYREKLMNGRPHHLREHYARRHAALRPAAYDAEHHYLTFAAACRRALTGNSISCFISMLNINDLLAHIPSPDDEAARRTLFMQRYSNVIITYHAASLFTTFLSDMPYYTIDLIAMSMMIVRCACTEAARSARRYGAAHAPA